MNTVRYNVLKKINAIMIIIALFISNFWVVGDAAISYALELVETNNANVNFSAYFLDEDGEKVEKLEKEIDEEEQYLYVDISVKNEGYFNGEISFKNNNFAIKEEILSEDVLEVTANKVVLKQINAGSTVTIKLGIEPLKDEVISEETLNSKVEVILQGKYVNGKKVEKDKFIEINGTSEIEVKWTSSSELQAELNTTLLTNAVYNIEGQEKRIMQVLVESTVTNNEYPIKNTEININTLKNAEEVQVHARSTEGTNENIEFKEENYTYDKEEGILTIKLENEDKEKISWKKEGEDTFVITYVFNKDEKITEKEIEIKNKITMYDEKTIEGNQKVKIEEKEGVVSFDIKTEEEIYKGKIYTGEEKEYKVNNAINVDYASLVNNINIKAESAKYIVNEEEIEAEIFYKETKINKQEFIKLFGEEGYITIKDQQGTIIGNINKDSQIDEQGNVVIKYIGETKNIEITTSKPEDIGTLNIEHTKTIINKSLPREKINEIASIKEMIAGQYNEEENIQKEAKIELKNTVSKAEMEVNAKKLSTIEKNENIKITAILLNNDESKDLYQNPVVRITLPKQVKSLSAKCKLLYGNGLSLESAKIVKENETNIIEIKLSGTQATYNTEIVKGTTLIIYADMELDELAPNSNEKITLTYTNEIGTSLENNGVVEVPVEIQSLQGVITTNSIETIKIVGDQGTKKVNLPVSKEAKDLSVKISTINNKGTDIKDAKILGTFPTSKEDNLNAVLTSGINLTSGNENVEIYYSNNENATDDLTDTTNGWSKQIKENTTKKYLIVAESVKQGEKIEANYNIKVPENLGYNMSASENYTINYLNTQNGEKEGEKAATIQLTTGAGPDIDIEMKATVGNDEVGTGTDEPQESGQNVTIGEIIKYEVTLTNRGNEDATNVVVKEKLPKNATALKYERKEVEEGTSGTGIPVTDFKEVKTNEPSLTLERLKTGESKIIILYLRVDAVRAEDLIERIEDLEAMEKELKVFSNHIEVTYNNRIENKYLTNTVIEGNVSTALIAEDITSDVEIFEAGKEYEYILSVTNLTENQLQNIDVEFLTDGEYQINKIRYYNEDQEIATENENKINIANMEPFQHIGVYITFVPKTKEAKSENFEFYCIVKENNHLTRSNKLKKQVHTLEVNLDMEANNVGETIDPGQEINYTIKVRNPETSVDIEQLVLEDVFANIVDVQSVQIDNKTLSEKEYRLEPDWNNDENGDILDITTSINKGEEKTIVVKAKVLDDAQDFIEQDREIQNSAVAKRNQQVIANSDRVIHVLKAPIEEKDPDDGSGDDGDDDDDEEDDIGNETEDQNFAGEIPGYELSDDDDNNNTDDNTNQNQSSDNVVIDNTTQNETENQAGERPDENNNTNKPTDNVVIVDGNGTQNDDGNSGSSNTTNSGEDNQKPGANSSTDRKNYSIAGTAWLDKNEDGVRDTGEEKVADIPAILINAEKNSQQAETKTDSDGNYSFTQLPEGKYIVAFRYDTEKYVLTKYQVENASENKNSDAEVSEITVNGDTLKAGITDTIEIKDASKMNVDVGLIEAKKFDLELTKTIAKITTTNDKGTVSTDYEDEQMAKIDIEAKYLSGTSAIIEYKIKVKNNGELAGYAKEIVDYMPKDLAFNSELNKDWYKSGDYVYSTSLANTKIEPGETKELTLVLTKTMTETNTGLVNNLAEISSDYNSLNIQDIDSTAGNKQNTEDDLGSANIIISVKTGAAISYISITFTVITGIIVGAYIVNKKILKEHIKF